MNAAARGRSILLAIIGLAFLAPLLGGTAIAAATSSEQGKPATMAASTGLLGLALAGPLREEDPGDPSGGGSDPKADDPKLTVGQRLSAALASKTSLQAQIVQRDATITEHAAEIERLKAELATAQGDLAKANAKIATLEADAAEVDKALKAAEAEAKGEKAKNTTVEKRAQEKVAGLGFSAEKLPAADDSASDSIDDLRERMQASTDPKEKQALMKQIRTLRDAA